MAPQPDNPPPKAATVLGAIGTFCWCVQIIPQIYKNWRRHSTEGVPGWMVFLWASAMPLFGAYCLIQNINRAIQVQPQLFCSLCLICWGQTLYYAKKYKPWQAALIVLVTGTSFAAVELILFFTLRISYKKNIDWPMNVLGVTSGIMINLGLVAPFIDAAKRDWRIIGISFRFLSIDFAGAVFSLLSLCFQDTINRYAAGSYIAVMALEVGICVIQGSWILRKWGTLREARRVGKSFDEFTGVDAANVTPIEKKKEHEFVQTDDGSEKFNRNWSISSLFAALNRRHIDPEIVGEAEKVEAGVAGPSRTVKEVNIVNKDLGTGILEKQKATTIQIRPDVSPANCCSSEPSDH